MELSVRSCALSGATTPSPVNDRTGRMRSSNGCRICSVAKNRRRGPQRNEACRAMGEVQWTGQRHWSKARWPAAGEAAEDRFWQMDGTLDEEHNQTQPFPLADTRCPYERS